MRDTPETPTNESPASNVSILQQINAGYIKSNLGIIRLIIILFQFAGWVSAAVFPFIFSSRSAYLVFSILGWIIAIFVTIIYAFNLKIVEFKNLDIFVFIQDLLLVITMFFTSIFVAVDESNLFYAKGPLGSASFFGFCCVILYAADAFFVWRNVREDFIKFFNNNKQNSDYSNPPSTPSVVMQKNREYQI